MWVTVSISRTFGVAGESLSVAVDVPDAVGLDGDVGLHQSVFLQQVLHAQQVLPVILRQQQHLQVQRRLREASTNQEHAAPTMFRVSFLNVRGLILNLLQKIPNMNSFLLAIV